MKSVWSDMKQAKKFWLPLKIFLFSMWVLKFEELYKLTMYFLKKIDCDSVFPAEINTLEQNLPDLCVPLSCSLVYCHLNNLCNKMPYTRVKVPLAFFKECWPKSPSF